ncbi:MAG: hypothetical protein CMF62_03015 [Magnetococcales bacterium]|nr:hypothetical protein [Magnetococcales bacterium]|tara:strand:- start:16610 stop:17365 length:756 start_codon:yes stop_codon:yes gene_type:complete
MSELKLHKYKIFCNTDNRYEYIWLLSDEDPPSSCPVDRTHTINLNNITIIETQDNNTLKVKEESISTGGRYRLDSHSCSCPPGESTHDISYNYPLNAVEFTLNLAEHNNDDTVTAIVGPQTTVTRITQDVTLGDKIITVDDSTLLELGLIFYLDDGTNLDNLGQITNINSNLITVQNEATYNFSSNSPTIVKSEVLFVNKIKFASFVHSYTSGVARVGAISYLEANRILRIKYNNTSDQSTTFTFYIEYLY